MLAVVAGAGGAQLLAGGAGISGQVPPHNVARLLAFSLEGAVYTGLLSSTGMPGFMVELTPQDVEALRAYVVEPAHDTDAKTVGGSES